jgi:acylphosphatase
MKAPEGQTHLLILVSGKVQGVWYRKSACDMALELGLKGYAQNLPDGQVRLEVEGPKEQLAQLVDWCRTGPPLARVQQVQQEEVPWVGYPHFTVRR